MRIVIDLQGAQCGSRHRGIGRYSLALAQAMVKHRGPHDIILALNGLFPETIEPIRGAFNNLLPQENIRVWNAVGPVHGFDVKNNFRRHSAEFLRESFLASLRPDIVHVTSLMEGFGDDAVHSIGLLDAKIPTAVTFYDLIPLIQNDIYLEPNPLFKSLYMEKLAHLKKADIFLAISESSKREAVKYLNVDAEQVINIAAAADSHFRKIKVSSQEQQNIQSRFGLTRPFLMYSGATDERKNHLKLIKAFSILPSEIKSKFQLAIVGGLPQDHRDKFNSYIKLCGLEASDVLITGRVSDREMVALYNLCDLFVFPSWHEGFGLPALEAMSCGAAVIGSNTTSVPEVIGRNDCLFSPFDEIEMAEKIVSVLTDVHLKDDIAGHGLQQAKNFTWDRSAKLAISEFEKWHSKQPVKNLSINSIEPNVNVTSLLVQHIGKIEGLLNADDDLIEISKSIAQNHPRLAEKQLLVDVSELVQRDAKTGIQRVVRAVLAELFSNPPAGYVVKPVYASNGVYGYRYAKDIVKKYLSSTTSVDIVDEAITISSDDIFLGLDLHHLVLQQSKFYEYIKNIGVKVYFVLYDLAPVLFPKYFPNEIPALHSSWLSCLAKADGIICISRAVADEMAQWLGVFGEKRFRPLSLGWFHLGADVETSIPTRGLPENANLVLSTLTAGCTFVMVGTVEPRKGQLQTLLAFEQLWNKGINVNLVLIGKQGWNVDLLVEMVKSHREYNHRLFWLKGISDEYLDQIYSAADCLIAASEIEGFGLPLIEAAQHKLPIIARDIPVFREVAGEHAYYFSGLEPVALADAVFNWLELDKAGQSPQSSAMPWLTWKQSTQNLLDVMLGGQWYQQWMPDEVKRFWGGDSRMGTQTGKRCGREIQSIGQAGYLLFGPYIPLDAGRYQVAIRGTMGVGGIAGARMDAVVDRGAVVLVEAPLTSSDENGYVAIVEMSLDAPCSDLEIRVWVSEQTELSISLIEIAPYKNEQDAVDVADKGIASNDPEVATEQSTVSTLQEVSAQVIPITAAHADHRHSAAIESDVVRLVAANGAASSHEQVITSYENVVRRTTEQNVSAATQTATVEVLADYDPLPTGASGDAAVAPPAPVMNKTAPSSIERKPPRSKRKKR